MHESDRVTAMAMYDKMFELAPDEEGLIKALASPTRQAVQIARVYDANDTRLSYNPDGEEEIHGSSDAYIATIRNIFSDVLDSMPDKDEQPDVNTQVKSATDSLEQIAGEKGVAPKTETASPALRVYESEKVEKFLDEFEIVPSDEELREEAVREPETVHSTGDAASAAAIESVPSVTETAVTDEKKTDAAEEKAPESTKLSGGALALFLVIAIPLTALALIADFIVALGFLGLAGGAGLMCFRVLQMAFSSFRVFADVLVITGTGFILGAIAVLFLWTAIWLVVGVSRMLVNGIVNLAIRLCGKEVPKKDD